MFAVEVYAAVRRYVFVEGHSRREASRVFGLTRETVLKMCRSSLPPGYTRTLPAAKPNLMAILPATRHPAVQLEDDVSRVPAPAPKAVGRRLLVLPDRQRKLRCEARPGTGNRTTQPAKPTAG
jgi:hypothetical protein